MIVVPLKRPYDDMDTPALSTPWFPTLAFRTVREFISIAFSHTVCGHLQPQETYTPSGREARASQARSAATSGQEIGPWPSTSSSQQSHRSQYSLVVLPDIWMMHLESRLISRELKGRTRTATFTEAPAISATFVSHSWQRREQETPWEKGRRELEQYLKRQRRCFWLAIETTSHQILSDTCIGFQSTGQDWRGSCRGETPRILEKKVNGRREA